MGFGANDSCCGSKDGACSEHATQLTSRIQLHDAKVSMEWKVSFGDKRLLLVCAGVIVILGAMLSTNLFLFRRMIALEDEVYSLRRVVDNLALFSVAPGFDGGELGNGDIPGDGDLVRPKREMALALPASGVRTKEPERQRRRKRAGESAGRLSSGVVSQNDSNLATSSEFYPPGGAGSQVRVVQFRPCLQAIHVSDAIGVVAGWRPDWAADPFRYQFDALRSQITILEDGLYFFYSQLYFFHSFETSGYEVFLHRSDTAVAESPIVVARCSVAGSNPGATAADGERSEASCYTSAVFPLTRGDSVFIRVREVRRYLNLARGHSFMGLMKLAKRPGSGSKKKNRRGDFPINDPQCPIR